MKNILIVLICIITNIFVSCSKKEKPEEPKVKLVFATHLETIPIVQKTLEVFNKKQNNIEVVLDEYTGETDEQHDKFLTKFSMKSSSFDILSADVIWVAEFAQAGYVLSLDEYIKRDKIDLSNYMEGSNKAVTYKNKIWGIHRFVDAGMLYYRTDIVKDPPKTWDQLIELSIKYKGKFGIVDGFCFQARQYEGLVCNVLEYIYGYGGEVIDSSGKVVINSKASEKGLKKFIEIVHSGIVPKDIAIYRERETEKNFLDGKSVFSRNWPYIWKMSANSKIAGKIGVTVLPRGDKRSAATLGGWIAMINMYSKYPEESWEFVKFLAGPEGQKIWAVEGGFYPTYLPLYKDPDVIKANPHMGNKNFVKALKAALPRPVSPVYPQLSYIIQIETTKVINKEISVKQALRNMEKEMNRLIKKEKVK